MRALFSSFFYLGSLKFIDLGNKSFDLIAVNILALGLANLVGGLFVIGHHVSLSCRLLFVANDSETNVWRKQKKNLFNRAIDAHKIHTRGQRLGGPHTEIIVRVGPQVYVSVCMLCVHGIFQISLVNPHVFGLANYSSSSTAATKYASLVA